MDKKDVMIASAETAKMESIAKRWKPDAIHPVYVDSKIILAVFLVYDVDPNDIHDTHRDQLEMLILKHVSDYDPYLDVRYCKIVESISYNSSFI